MNDSKKSSNIKHEKDRKFVAPNPGSQDAIDQGCTCPVLDNRHGKGAYLRGDNVFWIDATCPIHGDDSEWEKKRTAEKKRGNSRNLKKT